MNHTLSLVSIRFLLLFFVLFVFFFNNGAYPFLWYIQQFVIPALHTFIPWVGTKLLSLPYPITVFTNGSGDTTYDYVVLLSVLVLAAGGTIVWSVLDRKRTSHRQLFYWLTVLLRFYVGFMLVQYGIAKLNNGQFPSPSPYRLTATYGDSSPMGIAWTFLGFSEGYKWFMCVAELMGLLLFFRRTAAIGALMSLMTAANIMAINYFFDVPVKIVSTALVVMCLILLSPNFQSLYQLFFKGAMVRLKTPEPPVFKQRWARIAKLLAKYAAILLYAGVPLFMALKTAWIDGEQFYKTAVYGAYDIRSLNWEQQQPSPDSTYSSNKWKQLGFDNYNRAFIRLEDGEPVYFTYNINQFDKKVYLTFPDKPAKTDTLRYQIAGPEELTLKGRLFGQPAVIVLEKKKFELMDRGFHWISEYPYNR